MVKKKPFYKQFLRLKTNVQNRSKLNSLKKKKWLTFQKYSNNSLKFFKRYKFKDQFRLFVNRFASRGNSFKKKYKNNLHERKLFILFYGTLKKNYLKKNIKVLLKTSKNNVIYNVIEFFESRLDTVLFRSGFCLSISEARKFILQKHVFVNKRLVKTSSYLLKPNDLIEVSTNIKSRNLVKKKLLTPQLWYALSKHLLINYNTLQILFLYNNKYNLRPAFNHYLNLNSVVANIKKW